MLDDIPMVCGTWKRLPAALCIWENVLPFVISKKRGVNSTLFNVSQFYSSLVGMNKREQVCFTNFCRPADFEL